MRFVIELTVEPVVLRGRGGGGGSDKGLLGEGGPSDFAPWDKPMRPGMYDLTSGREL
jgi:hypothetical protein